MSWNPTINNIEKLHKLMKSYIDEQNYDYALCDEILNKLELADRVLTIFGLIYFNDKGEKKND